MNEDDKYSISDLIGFGIEQKPIEFSSAFDSLITGRIAAAVDDRKQYLAQNVFSAGPEDPDEQDDTNWDDDDLEFEDDDDSADEEEGEDE
jgi:hypothetical protein